MQIAISQTIKNECKDYFYITLGLLLYTFGWTIFLLPYQIVTGGVTGIAAVIYYGTGIPIYLSYFLINAALLLAALKTKKELPTMRKSTKMSTRPREIL